MFIHENACFALCVLASFLIHTNTKSQCFREKEENILLLIRYIMHLFISVIWIDTFAYETALCLRSQTVYFELIQEVERVFLVLHPRAQYKIVNPRVKL